MKIDLPPIPEAERTPPVVARVALIDTVPQRVRQLGATVQQLRDERAVLKGQRPRPAIAPGRLETPPTPRGEAAQRPGSARRSENACVPAAAGVGAGGAGAPERGPAAMRRRGRVAGLAGTARGDGPAARAH